MEIIMSNDKNKRLLDNLVIFGGKSVLSETLHVGRPNKGEHEYFIQLATDILERQWLTNDGPVVRQFEGAVACFLDVKHCIAVCNATTGLQLLFHALELRGEIIMPAFTFVATPHAASWIGLKPVFCDVDECDHNLNPVEVEKLITPETSAILGVHLWGNPCKIDELSEIAARHDLKVIFDAAQAFGASYGNKMIGNFGEAEVFSFHATKMIHAFEGGIISTNNSKLADKLRKMRNFGFSESGVVESLGTNAKLPEMSAAMGLVMLEQLERLGKIATANHQEYAEHLAGIPGIKLIDGYQYIVIVINQQETGISRDELADILIHENVQVKKYFSPGCDCLYPYNNRNYQLLVTRQLCEQCLVLPSSENVNNKHIKIITDIIRLVIKFAPEVKERMVNGGKI
jgi:dTDP-4-amino-4,6-dideoxygalactose transaminase